MESSLEAYYLKVHLQNITGVIVEYMCYERRKVILEVGRVKD